MQTQDELDQTPDTVSALYIDLPTVHDGTELNWKLVRTSEKVPRFSSYPPLPPYSSRDYDRYGDRYSWTDTVETITLILTYGEAEKRQTVEDVLDKDIIAAGKSLIAAKERDFRLQLLEEGPVAIWPKKK